MKIRIDEIRIRTESIFQKVGLSNLDAQVLTEVLLNTEMRGVFTHGIFRVPNYVKCLESGGTNKVSELHIVSDTPSWASVDGDGGLGIILSHKAMELAIQKAKNTGIGIVNIRNSHHFGAAGYYAGMCADQKMIGLSMSNGSAMLAPTGGCRSAVGNNPFAFAAPAGKYDKLLLDIAMSGSSDIKILQMAKEGKPLPPGWLIDKAGNPTTDASAYPKNGVLLPFGGHKGYGLAMMVEVLAAALSGAATLRHVKSWNMNPDTTGNTGHMFMALDVEQIQDIREFEQCMETMIDELKATEKAAGVEEIYYPGEIELKKLRKCLESGEVEIADDTMLKFAQVEEQLGLTEKPET